MSLNSSIEIETLSGPSTDTNSSLLPSQPSLDLIKSAKQKVESINYLNLLKNQVNTNKNFPKHLMITGSFGFKTYAKYLSIRSQILRPYKIKRHKNITMIHAEDLKKTLKAVLKALYQARDSGLSSLRSFKLDLLSSKVEDREIRMLRKILCSGLSNLQNLDITSNLLTDITSKSDSDCSLMIRSSTLPKLKSLRLISCSRREYSKDGTSSIVDFLRYKPPIGLKGLEIAATECWAVFRVGLAIINRFLRKNRSTLENLRLDFGEYSHLRTVCVEKVSEVVDVALLNLKSFRINLTLMKYEDESVHRVLDVVKKRIGVLGHINLDVDRDGNRANLKMGLYGSNLSKNCPKLNLGEIVINSRKDNEDAMKMFVDIIVKERLEITNYNIKMKERISWNSNISSFWMKKLGETLQKPMPKLIQFKLDLEWCRFVNLLKFSSEGCNLEEFSLSLTDCPDLTDEEINYFSKDLAINQSRTLKHLHYNISHCEKLKMDSLVSINEILSTNNAGLKTLDLNFIKGTKVSEEGFLPICNTLQNNKTINIEDLRLNFSNGSVITDNTLVALSEAILNNLPTMRHLELSLHWYSITDIGIACLARSLKALSSTLEDLSLSFSSCKFITDEGIIALGQSLEAGFGKLKELKLHFNHCEKITDKGLISLFEGIEKGSINMRFLDLNMVYMKIEDQGVKALCKAVQSRDKELEKCNILIDGSSLITDNSANYLQVIFGKGFDRMKRLDVEVKNCSKVTYNAQQSLLETIQRRKRMY